MPSLFASYLRVYEPLTAFDRDRQSYWRRYVKEGRAVAPVEGPGRQRTAVIEALGAGWTRLPDLPEEAYVLETDDTPAGLPVEPADPGRRGGAERPGRGAAGARRRVRAADAGRAGQGGGGGLAQRGAGAGARRAPGARADRHLGRAAALVRALRAGGAGPGHRAGAAGAALPHGDLQGASPGVTGRCRCCASRSARRRSPRRSRRPPAGWRSSTRARWSSWTTAAWSSLLSDETLAADDSPGLVAAGLAGLSPGRGRGGVRGVRQVGRPLARGAAAGAVQLRTN